MTRNCDHCKEEYEAVRPRSRFCSADCRVNAHRKKAAPPPTITPESLQRACEERGHILIGPPPAALDFKIERHPLNEAACVGLRAEDLGLYLPANDELVECDVSPELMKETGLPATVLLPKSFVEPKLEHGLSAFQLAMRKKKLGY